MTISPVAENDYASTLDKLNSWARESHIPEGEWLGGQDLADRLWAHHSGESAKGRAALAAAKTLIEGQRETIRFLSIGHPLEKRALALHAEYTKGGE